MSKSKMQFNPLTFPYYSQWNSYIYTLPDGYKFHSTRYVLCDRLSQDTIDANINLYSNIRFMKAYWRYSTNIVYDVIEIFDKQLSTINKHLPQNEQIETILDN